MYIVYGLVILVHRNIQATTLTIDYMQLNIQVTTSKIGYIQFRQGLEC